MNNTVKAGLKAFLPACKASESILDKSGLKPVLKGLQEQGKKVVFTNGCFDILHRGHVAYMEAAKALGDVLVVGVNSDSSVKLQGKGDDRPFNGEYDRAYLIASLKSVDFVVIFPEKTAIDIIDFLRPDIQAKGGDYKVEDILEAPTVHAYGGEVKVLPLEDGYSTTNLAEKIRKA